MKNYSIYALSDAHGMNEKFDEAIKDILSVKQPKDKIIILGDNIDRGLGSLEIIQSIMSLQEKYGSDNVIALMGNHEEMFLAWLKNRYNTLSLNNGGTRTVASFIGDAFKINDTNLGYDGNGALYDSELKDRTKDVIGYILQNHAKEIKWMKNLKYFHEEGDTLFVHAGFEETPSLHWTDSSKDDMVWKYPAEMGYTPWNKRVVAGHIMTRELNNPESIPQEKKNNIYRNKDHIYIDGGACSEIFGLEGQLNILQVKYEDKKETYYDFRTGNIIPE